MHKASTTPFGTLERKDKRKLDKVSKGQSIKSISPTQLVEASRQLT